MIWRGGPVWSRSRWRDPFQPRWTWYVGPVLIWILIIALGVAVIWVTVIGSDRCGKNGGHMIIVGKVPICVVRHR